MARPVKEGLTYFTFDVDFFEDEKIEAISGEFGIKGELVAIKLLCAIYRNGYFIVWNEMLKMKLLRNLQGINKELLEKILNRLVRWGFFDESLFNSEKILTSTGIQKRYSESTKRRKNQFMTQYLLIDGVNVYNNPNSSNINVNIGTQSKVKESKCNNNNQDYYYYNTYEKVSSSPPSLKYLEYLEEFKNFLYTANLKSKQDRKGVLKLYAHMQWKTKFKSDYNFNLKAYVFKTYNELKKKNKADIIEEYEQSLEITFDWFNSEFEKHDNLRKASQGAYDYKLPTINESVSEVKIKNRAFKLAKEACGDDVGDNAIASFMDTARKELDPNIALDSI
jgi:hypothetical protein